MDDINQSATNISKIIKVIDEIAFQTNLLALNAAVEKPKPAATRKGFTVWRKRCVRLNAVPRR